MKKIILFFLLIFNFINAQEPYWNWAKINQPLYDETIVDTKFDSKGNFYVLGRFQLTLTIDNISINCPNGRAGYIAKYNKNAEIVWAKDFNPLGKQLSLYALNIDNNDDVIIGGGVQINSLPFFQINYTPITFDNNSHNLTIPLIGEFFLGSYYQFIVKFNSNGQFQWVKESNGISETSSITSDQNNNIFVAGSFSSNMLKIENFEIYKNLMYQGIPDGFIAKYDSNGNILNLKGFGGDVFDFPKSIKLNNNNNISIAGYFNSPNLFFDNEIISNSNNNNDIFHIEVDSDLNFISKYSIDNFEPYNSNSDPSTIYLNSNNEVIIYGNFSGNNYSFLGLNLNKIGFSDLYVTKYNNGNRLWVKQIGVPNSYLFLDKINEDKNNNLYLASDFTSENITLNNTTLNNNCDFTSMIIKLDDFQNIKWIKGINGNSEGNFPVSIDNYNENILIGGFVTSDSLIFDEITLNYNTGWQRSYLAMLKENFSLDDQISIYPNPVIDEINILSSTKIYGKRYQVIDILGKIINEKIIDNYSNIIKVTNLQNGIYFLKIEDYKAIKFIKI
ncbi:T9SS type A sorting domain-containing protein [Flavobacterium sp.]|uniref:T9SS type A sorting domain-containing protein n=1 Tax=Flavobacterium sp. TaxID=239 RepID=UPI00261E72F3|nr:T9SS type A sorting domain-containing protein [Flavobacterium sp.]